MPRWASRLTVEITAVRVERLQAITEDDARAEGAKLDASPCDHPRHSCADVGCLGQTHRAGFCEGWDELNLKRGYGWLTNPWVWVIEFRPIVTFGEMAEARP